ncbi:MAG: hypothetical protein PUF08_07535 [Clostridiales bacterium]|nr:hypothetical protein [Clostridiales bacterium]
MCKSIDGYNFSSYNEYVKKADLVDTVFCLGIINKEQFIDFNNEYNEDICLEIEKEKLRLTDAEAVEIIFKISKCRTITQFQNLNIEKRDKYLKLLRNNGLSIRQISRLTGIGFNIVRKFK